MVQSGGDDLACFSEVAGQLYEAVLQPARLHDALTSAVRWLAVDSAHFIGWDTSCFVPRIAVIHEPGVGPDHVHPDYIGYFSQIDPRRARMAEVAMGQIAVCTQFFDQRFVDRSEFFQKFLLPRGRRYTLGAHLYRDERFDFYITFYLGLGRPDFSPRQLRHAKLLVPHLQRVARLLVQQDTTQAAADVGAASLDALDLGVVALDARGEVLFKNRRAQALLRDGRWLVQQGSKVRPAGGLQAALDDMLAQVRLTGLPDSCVLRRAAEPGGEPQWCGVTVTRLSEAGSSIAAALHPRAALLMLLSVPNGQRTVTAAQLMRMFGLTQAEARLTQALVGGQSVDDYAQAQGVGVSTVRTQVRSVLGKTDAQRQQDLVRMLAALPSARPPVGL